MLIFGNAEFGFEVSRKSYSLKSWQENFAKTPVIERKFWKTPVISLLYLCLNHFNRKFFYPHSITRTPKNGDLSLRLSVKSNERMNVSA